jgi:hypothetical protein
MDELTLETTLTGIVLTERDPEFEDDTAGYVDLKFRLLRKDDKPVAVSNVRVFIVEPDRDISLGDLTKAAIAKALYWLALTAEHGGASVESAPDDSSHPEWFR